jgi:putative membrane protein
MVGARGTDALNGEGSEMDPEEERTDLSEDRTLLANERTFGGWMRTGLAAVGVALGLHALFRSTEPLWVAKAIATAFILCGLFVFWAAERRALRIRDRLSAHEVALASHRTLRLVAIALGAASLSLILAVWILV